MDEIEAFSRITKETCREINFVTSNKIREYIKTKIKPRTALRFEQ